MKESEKLEKDLKKEKDILRKLDEDSNPSPSVSTSEVDIDKLIERVKIARLNSELYDIKIQNKIKIAKKAQKVRTEKILKLESAIKEAFCNNKDYISFLDQLENIDGNKAAELRKKLKEKPEEKEFYCPYCGSELTSESSFCPFCGAKVEDRIEEMERVSISNSK